MVCLLRGGVQSLTDSIEIILSTKMVFLRGGVPGETGVCTTGAALHTPRSRSESKVAHMSVIAWGGLREH